MYFKKKATTGKRRIGEGEELERKEKRRNKDMLKSDSYIKQGGELMKKKSLTMESFFITFIMKCSIILIGSLVSSVQVFNIYF